jgi:integrase/recombinase XerC
MGLFCNWKRHATPGVIGCFSSCRSRRDSAPKKSPPLPGAWSRMQKGRSPRRSIPLHTNLHAALVTLQARCGEEAAHHQPVIVSERGCGLSAAAVQLWFHRLYTSLGLAGCSSHSGRRTFITRAARKVSEAGGSLRDVQQLAGHASLAMTQSYIEGDTAAKRKLIALI